MLLVKRLAAIADVEIAHFALDAARVGAATTTDASASCDFIQLRVVG